MVQWLILLPPLVQDDCFLSTLSRGPLLREMDTLTVLDLSENAIGDTGAATLAAVLRAAGQDTVGVRGQTPYASPSGPASTHCKMPQPQHAAVCFCFKLIIKLIIHLSACLWHFKHQTEAESWALLLCWLPSQIKHRSSAHAVHRTIATVASPTTPVALLWDGCCRPALLAEAAGPVLQQAGRQRCTCTRRHDVGSAAAGFGAGGKHGARGTEQLTMPAQHA